MLKNITSKKTKHLNRNRIEGNCIEPNCLRIPNLLEMQHVSFFHFLKCGLYEELQHRQAWFKKNHFELIFYPTRLRLETPNSCYQETLRLRRNYRTRIFLPGSLYNHQTHKVRFEWIVFGRLPLLTQQGHFLINGSTRICITQMIRGPGIYVRRTTKKDEKRYFYIDFVPERGIWTRFEKSYESQFMLSINNEPRLPLCLILQIIRVFSFSYRQRKEKTVNVYLKKYEIDQKEEKEFFSIRKNVQIENKPSVLTSIFLYRKKIKLIYLTYKVLSRQIYDFGKKGRQRLNESFLQILPLSFHCIIPTDLLLTSRTLNRFHQKKNAKGLDDFDSLQTRRLRTVGNLLQHETRAALFRFERRIMQRFEPWQKNRRLNLI